MSATDWISIVGAGVAALAFLVSGRALQLQRAGAAADTRNDFDELIRALWVALGKTFGDLTGQRSDAAPAGGYAALGEIQTLALRADDSLRPSEDAPSAGWHGRLGRLWSPPTELPEPNWFDAVVLATSFAQVWDIERSKHYWELAVSLCSGPDAEVASMAQVLTLRETGAFYYLSASDSDLKLARGMFERAGKVLTAEANGADFTHFQNSVTWFTQAQQEDSLGYTDQAFRCIREAWLTSTSVRAPWRRRQVRYDIAAFLAYAPNYDNDPSRVQYYESLPAEIKEAVARLQAEQSGQGAQNQLAAAAWQQGFAAAQQQMFAAQQQQSPGHRPPTPGPTSDPGSRLM